MKRYMPIIIAMSIALVFVVTHFMIEANRSQTGWFSQSGIIRLLDMKTLDFIFATHPRKNIPEPRVVIAAVDEKALDRYGSLPMNRAVLADLITQLTQGGARAIGFDIVFADEDKGSAFQSVKRFQELYVAEKLVPDAGGISFQEPLQALDDTSNSLDRALADLEAQLKRNRALRKSGVTRSLKALQDATQRTSSAIAATNTHIQDWQEHSQKFYDQLKLEISSISPDEALARAITASPQTILAYICYFEKKYLKGLSDEDIQENLDIVTPSTVAQLYEKGYLEVGDALIEQLRPVHGTFVENLDLRRFDIVGVQATLPHIGRGAKHFGYFNAHPDPDGPVRTLPLVLREGNRLHTSLAIQTAATYFDSPVRPLLATVPENTIEGIDIGADHVVPTTANGTFQINYYKDPAEYFPTYSIVDLINGNVAPDLYRDKMILVGVTAIGGFDLRPNPFHPATPGVYIHAMALQNMVDGIFLQRPYGAQIWEAVGYILVALLLGLLIPRVPPAAGLFLTGGIVVALYVFNANVLFPSGNWSLIAFPTLEVSAIYVGLTVYGYLTEGREKRFIRNAFQHYLSKNVVDEVLDDPAKLQLGGEKRVCTVLFSDIRGFTTISERLAPDQLVALLNDYLTPMTNLVFKNAGTLDKYMGDAIMAIFGAPTTQPDHATQACYTALEMMSGLAELHKKWRAKGLPELDIGIGLNTGPMSAGNMGSEVRFDYTVMGDNVNLGSRLESINKQYGTNIIISEFTYEQAKEQVYARRLDSVRVKGKREPVLIFELLGRDSPSETEQILMDTFHQGLQLYSSQQWDEAIEQFDKVRNEIKPNDFASTMYVKRCRAMKEHPPSPDWDGVFTMTTK